LNATAPPGFPPIMPMPLNPAFVDYFNDGGNITTLDHVLNSAAIAKNATIRDVMNIRGDFVCAEYL
jgi:tyrosinase